MNRPQVPSPCGAGYDLERSMEKADPQKIYYSISEVSQMTGIKQHTLRLWEKDFTVLRPRKNRAGNRSYRKRDIQVVLAIKRLLKEERYTVRGASTRLRQDRSLIDRIQMDLDGTDSTADVHAPSPSETATNPGPSLGESSEGAARQFGGLLEDLRRELKELLRLLDDGPPEK